MDRRVSLVTGLLASASLMRRCALELENALASRDDARLRAAAESAMWTLRGGAHLRDAVAECFWPFPRRERKDFLDGSG